MGLGEIGGEGLGEIGGEGLGESGGQGLSDSSEEEHRESSAEKSNVLDHLHGKWVCVPPTPLAFCTALIFIIHLDLYPHVHT